MSIPDYFGSGIYSDLGPPFVDHLHERVGAHQSLLQYLTHRKNHLQQAIHQPDVDIRDGDCEYIIDIELPGVNDKHIIKIEWTSSRTLSVEGEKNRPVVADKLPEPAEMENLAKAPTGTRTAYGDWIPPLNPEVRRPTLVVAERKIGPFRRLLNFPVDVDMEHLTATLESGLLRLRVLKKAVHDGSKGRVIIQ